MLFIKVSVQFSTSFWYDYIYHPMWAWPYFYMSDDCSIKQLCWKYKFKAIEMWLFYLFYMFEIFHQQWRLLQPKSPAGQQWWVGFITGTIKMTAQSKDHTTKQQHHETLLVSYKTSVLRITFLKSKVYGNLSFSSTILW